MHRKKIKILNLINYFIDPQCNFNIKIVENKIFIIFQKDNRLQGIRKWSYGLFAFKNRATIHS
jgi:hypothetical protein